MVSGSPFSGLSEGSQGAFDQSGDFLFDFAEFLNSGTNTITWQMGALNVSSRWRSFATYLPINFAHRRISRGN